ncbi:MAG: YjgN family protein [Candidatus Methylomirabilales bacterium]
MTEQGPPSPPPRIPPTAVLEPPPHVEGGEDGIHTLFFYGKGGSLFGIYIVNMILTILTLGIYYFWGRVKVRNYLLSQTEFAGDRFAYHGTGKEMLMGFLKVLLLFWLPILSLFYGPELFGADAMMQFAAKGLGIAIILFFIPVATVGVLRYRMSRTSWRGIRFSFRGRVWDFMKIFLGGWFLTVITLGLYYPFFITRQYAFTASHSYFGNRKFDFDGQGRGLFKSFLLALLLHIPTLGLYWFWFQAKTLRYLSEHTSFGQARLNLTVTGGRLLMLMLGNMLLLVLTLGLGRPWVLVRNARFTCRYLTLEGPLPLAEITQEAQLASATGEGLASFLDLDTGFDFG